MDCCGSVQCVFIRHMLLLLTRHWCVLACALKELVSWYSAVRHIKLTRLSRAYPFTPVDEVKTILCLLFRRYRSSVSDFAYSCPFLGSIVCLSLCRLSHSCTLLKPFDGFRCHLACTLVHSNDTLC